MKAIRAKYDGKQILFNSQVNIKPNSKVIVLVLDGEEDTSDWSSLSAMSLSKAYGVDEPEYTISLVKEPNPNYERR